MGDSVPREEGGVLLRDSGKRCERAWYRPLCPREPPRGKLGAVCSPPSGPALGPPSLARSLCSAPSLPPAMWGASTSREQAASPEVGRLPLLFWNRLPGAVSGLEQVLMSWKGLGAVSSQDLVCTRLFPWHPGSGVSLRALCPQHKRFRNRRRRCPSVPSPGLPVVPGRGLGCGEGGA